MTTGIAIPLIDALSNYIDTQAFLRRVTIAADGDMSLSLSVEEPWWRPSEVPSDRPGTLLVELSGIARTSGHIFVPGECDWPVDWLDVLTEGHAIRELGHGVDIYANAPLRDPETFFLEFYDILKELGALHEIGGYLQRKSFAVFKEIAGAQSYKILSAPEDLAIAARRLLEKQEANISYLPWSRSRHPDAGNLLEVQINDAWVVCRRATATAD